MIKYTTVDRLLSIINRELGEANVFTDEDIVEWVGEAMEFLSVYPVLEESVKFLDVKDYKAPLPRNLMHILQIAKLESSYFLEEFVETVKTPKKENPCEPKPCDCYNSKEETFEYSYKSWINYTKHNDGFIPIRLSDNAFLKSLVCKEDNYKELYESSQEEYTIIGNESKELLFNFREGIVAISYVKMATDKSTGYPLIPDHADFIAAITYYIKWKISESMTWKGREGYSQLMQYARGEWLRYAKQAKNWAKMPKTLEDYQKSMEAQYNMIPDLNRYYRTFKRYKPWETL